MFGCKGGSVVDWRVDWIFNLEVLGFSFVLINRLICFLVVLDLVFCLLLVDIFKDVVFDLDLFEDIELGIWVD